ncbi:hypothetical protein RB195_016450 [Necator americanus]|uniref:Uncharacterized protein n=1 Tax=Necator americanus TaxID=51031 RepID=A0ABR1C0I3_NECAM
MLAVERENVGNDRAASPPPDPSKLVPHWPGELMRHVRSHARNTPAKKDARTLATKRNDEFNRSEEATSTKHAEESKPQRSTRKKIHGEDGYSQKKNESTSEEILLVTSTTIKKY